MMLIMIAANTFDYEVIYTGKTFGKIVMHTNKLLVVYHRIKPRWNSHVKKELPGV